jgi:hypothetical protein
MIEERVMITRGALLTSSLSFFSTWKPQTLNGGLSIIKE